MDRDKCKVDGCHNLVSLSYTTNNGRKYYRTECEKHHRQKFGMPTNYSSDRKFRERCPANKCSICGWDGPCDRHRIKYGCDGGKYVLSNVSILCPNCHRLVHKGLLRVI